MMTRQNNTLLLAGFLLQAAVFTSRHNLYTNAFQSPQASSLSRSSTTNLQSALYEHPSQDNQEEITSTIENERRKFFQQATTKILSVTTITAAVSSGAFSSPEPAFAVEGYIPDPQGGFKKPKNLGGLPKKIRAVGQIMDELQRDLMQERWDLVETYPNQLRSYVPIFTKFTDAAFPTDASADQGLRVALRYEVGRFFASLERLRQATARRSLNEAYVAYSDMSLHFDRYLHVGGLYTYYDANISNEKYFKGIDKDALVYADQKKDPALVRDLIVLTQGPDMGKTGIVIGIYPDEKGNFIVKFDRFMGFREIRVVPASWVGKRLGEQDPDDVFLIPRS